MTLLPAADRTAIGVVLFQLSFFLSTSVSAHEVRPVYLGITEVNNGVFDIVWKQGRKDKKALRLDLILPESCTVVSTETTEFVAAALIRRSQVRCPPLTFHQHAVTISGLSKTLTDVWIELKYLEDERRISSLANASNPTIKIDSQGTSGLRNYLELGIRHLLFGLDHILLIVGLMLFVTGISALLKIVTAFTIAHSLSLAVSTLNVIQVSARPVEAAIALSVVFLAVEASSADRGSTLTGRAPFAVAFLCGLLHGLGFAGAFHDIGLPAGHIVAALLLFNAGIEIGQLLLIAAILLFAKFGPQLGRVPVYVLGSVACFLFFKQLALLF